MASSSFSARGTRRARGEAGLGVDTGREGALRWVPCPGKSEACGAGQVVKELVHEDNEMGMGPQQTQPLQATVASVEQGVLGRAM